MTGHNPDKYDYYEQLFDPESSEVGRRRKDKRKTRPKQAPEEVITALTDEAIGLEAGFKTTYQPSRYESEWLPSSLGPFYAQDLITDVLAQVKGGKEATVYRCLASPSSGAKLLAAKVYRPRKFRNLRNDKVYREGRAVLTADGRPVKKNEHRVMRALNKKTAFGVQVAHTSWLMYEVTTLDRLYTSGVAVPKPISSAPNAILMGYVGDEQMAAPTLHEVKLSPHRAQAMLEEMIHYVELMLQIDLIHGDLSAYNILYWEEKMTIIDFPQVTSSKNNPHARASSLDAISSAYATISLRKGLNATPTPLPMICGGGTKR